MKILLVEDNRLTAELLAKVLKNQYYTVEIATDGQAGWDLIEVQTYDLIVLDVNLPKLDGITLCQRLRSQGNQTPIMLLTAKNTSTDKVLGLDAGADDYVNKPYNLHELLARIRALLRRGSSASPPLLEWRSLQVDPSTCEVISKGQPVHLTPKEYGLLELFLRNHHRIFSCSSLIDHLWSFEEPPHDDTVRSHLKGLRMKLRVAGVSDDPIETVYGIGYRLKPTQREGEQAKTGKNKKSKTVTTDTPNQTQIEQSVSRMHLHPSALRNPTSTIAEQTAPSVREIWERAKEDIEERVAIIEQATTLLLGEKLDQKLRSKAEQAAHKLVGSLGMFGADEGSHLAREIELQFQAQVPPQQHQVQHLHQLVVALRQQVQYLNAQQLPDLFSINTLLYKSKENHVSSEAKVMIVDDDPLVLTALASLLPPWGFKVSTLDNPLRFWDTLAAEQPDLLVLDVEMPSTSGIDLCKAIRDNQYWSGLPILFLTAHTDAETMHKVFAVGADDYVNKPIVEPELVTRILNRLQRTRLLRSLAQIDALTGVANRPKSTQDLLELLKWSNGNQQPFCLAIATVDDLKPINQQYGHAAGDTVLSQLGKLLRQTLRQEDVIGRWAGKEFVIGMPGLSKSESVERLSQALQAFRQIEFQAANGIQFQATFSAGVVQYPQDGTELQILYQAADTVLNQAARNQVISSV
ncbi:response regulator [Brasilonema sp. UFV-L1]|uniref:response regulator n=1 Tax=Brasilonema sp. UFV-L1 TaxID=2234130 RepID=UPI00145FC085|nr:response regulator [Brasilonema sp. UFV-L1]NMG08572.1 diguanylate cyclase [Brasilonema sp. UFV-L1]